MGICWWVAGAWWGTGRESRGTVCRSLAVGPIAGSLACSGCSSVVWVPVLSGSRGSGRRTRCGPLLVLGRWGPRLTVRECGRPRRVGCWGLVVTCACVEGPREGASWGVVLGLARGPCLRVPGPRSRSPCLVGGRALVASWALSRCVQGISRWGLVAKVGASPGGPARGWLVWGRWPYGRAPDRDR